MQRKQAGGVVDGSTRQSPSNKRSAAPSGGAPSGGAPSAVAQRPLRERIVHLLALKPYRKPDLLLWLERERASLKDKAELTSVLEEVRHLGRALTMETAVLRADRQTDKTQRESSTVDTGPDVDAKA